MDLADGHIAALNALGEKAGLHIHNLGTGNGTRIEMIEAFRKASGKATFMKIQPRRPGDIANCWSRQSRKKTYTGKPFAPIDDKGSRCWRYNHKILTVIYHAK